jgi:hypothetical protein
MTKFYVSDLWNDTSGHFFMYRTGYSYNNYPTIYLDQPASGYKQAKEVNTTNPSHVYGFKICRANMTGDTITIEGYFGAYHGYDNTRANFTFAIVPSSYVDVDSVPPNRIRIVWTMSAFGWSNGSYDRYAKVQFRINPDNTVTILSATPGNPYIEYASPYGLIGQDVTVLFGYSDDWVANWSQWACARSDSYIDLPTAVTKSVSDSAVGSDVSFRAYIEADSAVGFDVKVSLPLTQTYARLAEMESIVPTLRYVTLNDYVLHTDYNGVVEVCQTFLKLAEALVSELFMYDPEVRSKLEELRLAILKLCKVRVFDIVSSRDHNKVVEAIFKMREFIILVRQKLGLS